MAQPRPEQVQVVTLASHFLTVLPAVGERLCERLAAKARRDPSRERLTVGIGIVAVGNGGRVDTLARRQVLAHARGGRGSASVRARLRVLVGARAADVLCCDFGRAVRFQTRS